ncbi:hypothetical protein [Amycolatopsis saalfeldensis]|uniref:Photosynthesis system II assembly factor Ycf48/Hcf136-like domain-containing protein n=1 Tax=Amycolatopsis saalfeldensis TaxID=394193 RepID=A0A1H8Y2G0_9PSEU|nr:hypothetical protein [Amycolatopsis saalfeldensis]SEP46193.1 hypothetical protein SAMN04489732_110199 [Amycolatopsis saalfeldensis]
MKPIRFAALAAAVLGVFAVASPASADPAVPAGFAPSSTSWTSPERGLVLGFTDCGKPGWCPSLLSTTDGGKHWRQLPAPPMSLPDNHNQVRLTAFSQQLLYVTDGTKIVVTRDGGRHWLPVRQAGDTGQRRYVSKIAEARGRVFAVIRTYGDTEKTAVYSGMAGAPLLTPLPGFEVTGALTDGDVTTDGGVQISLDADFSVEKYWTSADGAAFAPATRPCPAGTTAVLGGVRDGQVVVLCTSGGGQPQPGSSERSIWRAPKLGGPFSSTAQAPVTGITQGFSAATADDATVSAVGGGVGFLHHTTDGGRTWSTVRLSERGFALADLDFPGAGTGVVVDGLPDSGGGSAVYRTTDGGGHWAELAFS